MEIKFVKRLNSISELKKALSKQVDNWDRHYKDGTIWSSELLIKPSSSPRKEPKEVVIGVYNDHYFFIDVDTNAPGCKVFQGPVDQLRIIYTEPRCPNCGENLNYDWKHSRGIYFYCLKCCSDAENYYVYVKNKDETKDEWQDISRIYTPLERILDSRLDCMRTRVVPA
ncbi:MAG: hypothetical protein GWN93_26835 [Deltaproteobacteria bacterium]|nr:hypothetical protein [Deltaproteobacteria bacterium]